MPAEPARVGRPGKKLRLSKVSGNIFRVSFALVAARVPRCREGGPTEYANGTKPIWEQNVAQQ